MRAKARRRSPEEHGPGAAALHDPAFKETERRGGYANFVNALDNNITGDRVKTFHDVNGRQTLLATDKHQITELLKKYKTEPDFKDFADAARMYVHNNQQMVDAARITLGKEPKWLAQTPTETSVVRIDPFVLLDGKMEYGGSSQKGLVSFSSLKHQVEILHDAIRGATPSNIEKYRGMHFDTNKHWTEFKYDESLSQHRRLVSERNNFKLFNDLKRGDEIDLPLSSFTTEPSVAGHFMDEDVNQDNILLILEPGHQSVNMQPFNSVAESEHLTGGVFKVLMTTMADKDGIPVKIIRIQQIGTY